MKQIILFASFIMMGAGALCAQTVKAPSTLNEINHYKKSDNSIEPLSKGKAEFTTKTKGMGFGGAATNFVMDGEKASFRIIATDTISFIVALADGMGDPSGWFSLFKADIKKGNRVANYVNTKVYAGKSGSGDGIINYSVKSLGKQVYEIIPSTKLEKGEYFFVNRGTLSNYGGRGADAFAFGID